MIPATHYNRVRFSRQAAAVERAHIKPHALRYSVGQHTHDALSLFIHCWREAHEGELPRAEAILALHIHDHPELITGDIPSPVKTVLGDRVDAIDRKTEKWLGFDYELTEEEQLYIAAADSFELYLWCLDEIDRGNTNVSDWVIYYTRKWNAAETSLPWPFMDLFDEANENGNLPQMTNTELMQIGGLDD